MNELIKIDSYVYPVLSLSYRPKALLDRTVAEIYGVETKRVNEAVKNNREKFPADFLFELTLDETRALNEVEIFDLAWNGGHLPKAFTWEGCNMLATILRSETATRRAIQIVRGFTNMERVFVDKTDSAFLKKELSGFYDIALFFGLEGNQARLAAAKAVKNHHGIEPIRLLELDLRSEQQDLLLSVTELGRQADPQLSPVMTNKRLEAAGLQSSFRDKKGRLCWQMTEEGKQYGVYLDTGKKHSDGTPVQQVKWYKRVLEVL